MAVPRPTLRSLVESRSPESEKHWDNFGGRELKVFDAKVLKNVFFVCFRDWHRGQEPGGKETP